MISIGIDIGGSSVKAALAEVGAGILARVQLPTRAAEGPEAVLDVCHSAIDTLLSHPSAIGVSGIGIGMPGAVDIEEGSVYHPPNFPGWEHVPLSSLVAQRWQLPVRIDNDANCAALGEAWFGNGRQYSHFVGITLGTGVGGGIIIDRGIYHGARGFAGEIGHLSIDTEGAPCNCGNRGCVEAYVGINYLMRRAVPLLARDSGSMLHIRALDTPELLTPRDLTEAAREGDETCIAILADAGARLGSALASTANLLDISTFIVGGGVSAAGDLIFSPMLESARSRVLEVHRVTFDILPAALGNDAGMLGAAALLQTA